MNDQDRQEIDRAADEEARAKQESEAKAQAELQLSAEAEYEARRAEAIAMAADESAIKAAALASQNGRILGVSNRTYPMSGDACLLLECQHIKDPDGDYWCPNSPTFTVVLVQGGCGDYAAYCGIGPAEWVAHHGDKLQFEEACIHFPHQLMKEKYRD